MSQRERVLKNVAIGLAGTALAVVLVAAVVTATRSTPAEAEAPHGVQELPPRDLTVAVADVAALERADAIEAIGGGVRVVDEPLSKRLGLGADDVITAISGREITAAHDVHEAIFDLSLMYAKTLYVELLRDHGPGLVRWRLDGDLRAARHSVPNTSYLGVNGVGSAPPVPDPLLDTIRTLDDRHADVPAATAKTLLADPTKAIGSTRIVPAISNGVPRGFKLYVIRPGSLLARLNFTNGDTVETINGKDITSPADALAAYQELRTAKQVTVELLRRGRPLTLEITVD